MSDEVRPHAPAPPAGLEQPPAEPKPEYMIVKYKPGNVIDPPAKDRTKK